MSISIAQNPPRVAPRLIPPHTSLAVDADQVADAWLYERDLAAIDLPSLELTPPLSILRTAADVAAYYAASDLADYDYELMCTMGGED